MLDKISGNLVYFYYEPETNNRNITSHPVCNRAPCPCFLSGSSWGWMRVLSLTETGRETPAFVGYLVESSRKRCQMPQESDTCGIKVKKECVVLKGSTHLPYRYTGQLMVYGKGGKGVLYPFPQPKQSMVTVLYLYKDRVLPERTINEKTMQ